MESSTSPHDAEEAIRLSDDYAPEHLELTSAARTIISRG